MLTIPPSLATLASADDRRLDAELRLARLRTRVAAIRAIADQAERLSRAADVENVGEQLIKEMARLGCQLIEAAGLLAEAPPPGCSGIFARTRCSR